jgi:hypothetical protein
MTRLGIGEKLLQAVLAKLSHKARHDIKDARCPIVDGHIVVWLMPHSLGCAFLADLGRFALERDGGLICRAHLVVMWFRLVGRVEAACGRNSPRDRGGP